MITCLTCGRALAPGGPVCCPKPPTEPPMSDHLDRAAEALWASVDNRGIRGRLFREDCDYLARSLDAAGLLVTHERDAAVAALPLPVDGCACTPHEQSAGGGYTEYLLEYEPACPEHSEHLWDPTQGAWVLRSERDAAVAAIGDTK